MEVEGEEEWEVEKGEKEEEGKRRKDVENKRRRDKAQRRATRKKEGGKGGTERRNFRKRLKMMFAFKCLRADTRKGEEAGLDS